MEPQAVATEFGVAIADDKLGAFPEWRKLTKFLNRPGFVGLARHGNVNDRLRGHVHDEERQQ